MMETYCLTCKRITESTDMSLTTGRNNRKTVKSKCLICNRGRCRFARSESSSGGAIDIHSLIGKLPKPKKGWVLPGHKYTGPYNPLKEQLDDNDNPVPGQEPFNQVDRISLFHDICYRDVEEKQTGSKNECDKTMLISLKDMVPKNMREKVDRAFVSTVIGAKHKLLLGLAEKEKKEKKWTDELSDELHRPVRRKFQRRNVIAFGIDDIWAADLVEMQPWAKYNKGIRYLLTVIDVFSKYGFMVPLKDKKGITVANAFRKIINSSGRSPGKLWTDKGKEFYNKHVQDIAEVYSTENEQKSSVVERWNRTMKERMFKYFTANNTNTYIDVLEDLVSQYNNTIHSSIRMTPAEASLTKNESDVYDNLYGETGQESYKKAKFQVGDYVRIPKKKGTFEKGYTPRWTEEVFQVSEVLHTNPVTYKINDFNDEPIKGSFYEQEMQGTKQDSYRIEKIPRKRGNKVLVKWKGYGPKFNSWIPADTIEKLK